MSKENSRRAHRSRRSGKGRKFGRFILILFAVLLVTGLVVSLFLMGKLRKIKRIDRQKEVAIAREEETFEVDEPEIGGAENTIEPEEVEWNMDELEEIAKDQEIKNILLIGQDRRSGQGRQRSDSMIICSFNQRTKEITMVSLMRDIYVPIPGYSDNRINAAYAFGGMTLLDQVIEQDFGLTIDANIEVDFDGFIAAMMEVGDIPMELREEEALHLNGQNNSWHLVAGTNMLTPEQALAYARIRKIGNADYERTERQRKVLRAAFSQIKNKDVVTLLNMTDRLFPNLTTDMNNAELLSYVYMVATGGMNLADESYRLPADGTFTSQRIRGMAVLVPDLAANASILKEVIYGTTS